MDMKETDVIHIALENLGKTTGIKTKWNNRTETKLDGKLTINIDDEIIKFNTEIKKELRNHQLLQLEKMAKQYPPFMIVAERIFPKIKEQLRQQKIAYLEANGNIYFKDNRFHYFIDINKPLPTEKEKETGHLQKLD